MPEPRYRIDVIVCLDDSMALGPHVLEAKVREALLLLPARVALDDMEVNVREIDPGEDAAPELPKAEAFAEMTIGQQLTHLRTLHGVREAPLEMDRLRRHQTSHDLDPADHLHIDQEEPRG